MRNRDEDELSDILIDDDEQEENQKGRSKKLFLIVAMAVILLLVVVFAIYALTREETPQQTTNPALAPAPTLPASGSTNSDTFTQIPATTPAVPSKDKFEDIIARIKNEQTAKPEIPAKPANTQPAPSTQQPATPPGATTANNDLQGLFKPQTPPQTPPPSQTTQPAPPPAQPAAPSTPPPAPKPAATTETPKQNVPPKVVDIASDPNGIFFIQAASVSRFSEDSDFAKKLKSHKLPYRVQEENVNNKTVYRVLIGPYGSRADAQKVLATVRYYLEKEAFIKQVN